jgi:hypothetical protein
MKALAALTLLTMFIQSASATQLIIGVAEQSVDKKPYGSAVVRALFAKNNGSWIALDSQEIFSKIVPSEVTWHLAFDGRNLGTLSTVDNLNSFNGAYSWTYKRDKILRINRTSDFPLLGNRESRFGGWRETPENRPIAIVSESNYKDVENWKRFTPSMEIDLLLSLVKEKIPQAYQCNGAPNWGATKINIKKNDIELFRSYKNKKGEKLISIGIKKSYTKDCDGPIDKTHEPMWFFVADGVKFVGFELDLVDVGDYDADGENEFLFWHGGYNSDGYTLFDSDFDERIDYYWSYH